MEKVHKKFRHLFLISPDRVITPEYKHGLLMPHSDRYLPRWFYNWFLLQVLLQHKQYLQSSCPVLEKSLSSCHCHFSCQLSQGKVYSIPGRTILSDEYQRATAPPELWGPVRGTGTPSGGCFSRFLRVKHHHEIYFSEDRGKNLHPHLLNAQSHQ